MPAKKAAKKVAKTAPTKTAKKAVKKTAAAPGDAPKVVKKAAKKTARTKSGPSTDEIAEAAYLNYRRRVEQGLEGNHEEDWLEAEQALQKAKK
ncbi:hypothetical protein KBB96_15605 [Luteolibacter ambystomatis]|uniref:DUF2934 domain-containing protein n=1 Tax=Luteolibacter ambystomatis TaxID=2824561 RepID=A0A975G7L7_9BACT|nr:hypothetical protein [Luteolibacter ambystomatis]QUE50287.1 hypothetical protein KBB96_15605 [Luteolibacter ambystomatis]